MLRCCVSAVCVQFFCDWLSEAAVDFRVDDSFLHHAAVACFGCANSLYEQHFNLCASQLSAACRSLGAARLCEDGVADESVSRTAAGTASDDFVAWRDSHLLPNLVRAVTQPSAFQAQVDAERRERKERQQREKAMEEKEEEARTDPASRGGGDSDDEATSASKEPHSPSALVDVEELGPTIHSSGGLKPRGKVNTAQSEQVSGGEQLVSAVRIHSHSVAAPSSTSTILPSSSSSKTSSTSASASSSSSSPAARDAPRPMLTSALRSALGKQGYQLIGSHSGVKLCRWTKAMLRGRGGCYKHTCYGIISYQCMEMTPSLACANKCVFCWRHGTNPVGKEWKWQVDEPELIIDGALQQHRRMVAQMKGVPGVKQERLQDALVPRHCALSLVGGQLDHTALFHAPACFNPLPAYAHS